MRAETAPLDLRNAVVVTPPNLNGPERKAVAMLVEEVEKRTGIRWPVSSDWPAGGRPAIAVTALSGLERLAGPHTRDFIATPPIKAAEGYHIRALHGGAGPAVFVLGADARGVLFGAGRLLRMLRMETGSVRLAGDVNVTSAPRFPLRGHQLGNRPLNNSVDAWTVARWEQHIRDLAVFGANAVELIPPHAFAGEDSPHFVLPPMEMMAEVSRLLDEYGMSVWLWYPALEKDYSNPRTVDQALEASAGVFSKLKRIDAVFVPGGDPGHTHPRVLMPYLEKLALTLRRFHPRAQMWVSPQGFDQAWLAEFYAILKTEPRWLEGIVHGPGVRVSAAQLRAQIPRRYPIRLYPDITHTVRAEYPVPDWDLAFALTYDREPVNPRPLAYAEIFRTQTPNSAGFITYSDGVNDDVNKMVWSALGWNPDTPVMDVLREYGRYFIVEGEGAAFAQGLVELESNWRGPLLASPGVGSTLRRFQSLERAASPKTLANWRFQQALYRAYYDAYVRDRLVRETALEARAMAILRRASTTGSWQAMERGEQVLDEAVTEPHNQDWRARVFELGAALYQSIGMQLSHDLYKANRTRRAASLDTVDEPLNDSRWLKKSLGAIRQIPDEATRIKQLEVIVNWKNPGAGGYYDDLGNPLEQPHLVREAGSQASSVNWLPGEPLAWSTGAGLGARTPVKMRYTELDAEAQYRVRVVYAGGNVGQQQGIRLMADGQIVVHPYLKRPQPARPLEFDVPVEATRDGELVLAWDREVAPSGSSRGADVVEVWLLRNQQAGGR